MSSGIASNCNTLGASGECPPGNPFSCGCFRAVGGQGADTLARFYALEDKGQLGGSSAGGIVTNIISYGYVVSNLQCRQAFVADQTIEIDCDNDILGNVVRLNNANCDACKTLAQQVAADRAKLEAEAAAANPAYVPQTVSSDLESRYQGQLPDGADGICKYVCLQCVADNIDQNIQMRIAAECKVDTDEFISAWTSGMSSQAEQEIRKHQTALKGTGLNIRNDEDIKSLALSVANTIRQMTTVEMLNALNQNALIVQETKIDPGSTSVVVQNVSQAISISMFASIVNKNYTDSHVQAAIDFKQREQTIQIETNFYDLVRDLEQSVKTIEKLMSTVVGQIMVALGAILMVVLLIFSGLFYFKPRLGVSSDQDTV